MLERNEEIEQPIPEEWRLALTEVVDAIKDRNLESTNHPGIEICVDRGDAELIYESIDSYGDPLVGLPEDTWRTSICRWMGGYWHLLIDLFTLDDGLSDLVLFVDVYESADSLEFKVRTVHVP